jgi:hypothetical protein
MKIPSAWRVLASYASAPFISTWGAGLSGVESSSASLICGTS